MTQQQQRIQPIRQSVSVPLDPQRHRLGQVGGHTGATLGPGHPQRVGDRRVEVLGVVPAVLGGQRVEPVRLVDRRLLDVRVVVVVDHVPLVVHRAGVAGRRKYLLGVTRGVDHPAGDREILRGVR